MISEKRKQTILEILKKTKVVQVKELSKILEASEVTIRRDLQELEDGGFLKRTQGGALNIDNTTFEPPMIELEKENVEQKQAIAKEAYEFISDNDAILLDSSSTVRQLANLIKNGYKRNITVVTNSFKTIIDLLDTENIELIHIGGQVRKKNYSTVGPIGIKTLETLRVDKAFMGVNGIDIQSGFTTPNIFESEIKRAIIKSARQVFVLADSSKFNCVNLSIICQINSIDYLITDNGILEKDYKEIGETGLKLIIAK